MKKILGCLAVMMLAVSVHATKIVKVADAVSVGGTVAFSSTTAVAIDGSSSFSYYLDIEGSAPDVSIEYQVTSSKIPADQYTQNVGTLDILTSTGTVTALGQIGGTWLTPATGGTLDSSVAVDQADAFAPMVTKWLRFLITGVSANGANTTVTLYLILYSEKDGR